MLKLYYNLNHFLHSETYSSEKVRHGRKHPRLGIASWAHLRARGSLHCNFPSRFCANFSAHKTGDFLNG